MSPGPFMPKFDQLGATLPIFPLAGALLLPRGLLPLNIFEPRYIAMIDDALAGDRMIGMVQPVDPEARVRAPAIYGIGCAGRITSLDETEDGRYLITLTGISRFRVGEEMPTTRGYRRVKVDWMPFEGDFAEPEEGTIDRPRLTTALGSYFTQKGIQANWDVIRQTPDEQLVTSLSMICPFAPSEKQALLEAPSLTERAGLMMTMLEMALLSGDGKDGARH